MKRLSLQKAGAKRIYVQQIMLFINGIVTVYKFSINIDEVLVAISWAYEDNQLRYLPHVDLDIICFAYFRRKACTS